MEPAHALSEAAPIQEVTRPAVAQADQLRKSRRVWGGVEGGAVLPTELGQHECSTHFPFIATQLVIGLLPLARN